MLRRVPRAPTKLPRHLREQPGVRVVRNGSRGMLWLEPMIEVATSEGRVAYGPVNAAEVPGLMAAGLLTGGEHSLRLGVTDQLPWMARQQRVTFQRVGIVDPRSLGDYEAHGGLAGLRRALGMQPGDVVTEVADSGLRGRGGAAFPTGIKWRTVLDAPGSTKYIACNADEGDSGTFADRMLMEGDPFMLLEGMTIAGWAVGANDGYVYIRSEYPDAIEALRAAIAAAEASGWLGNDVLGSGFAFRIHVRVGAGSYICGEETAMLDSLEGKRGVVRRQAAAAGVGGVVRQTDRRQQRAEPGNGAGHPGRWCRGLHGAGHRPQPWHAGLSTGRQHRPRRNRRDGIRHHVGRAGQRASAAVREAAGRFAPSRSVVPWARTCPSDRLDLPMDYEEFAAAGALLGHGGIVVFDDTVDMAAQARFAMEFCAIESCGKCTPCRIGSVRGVELIDKIVAGDNVDSNLAVLVDLCEVMTDASLCAMGGLTPLPVRSALTHFTDDFHQHPVGATV